MEISGIESSIVPLPSVKTTQSQTGSSFQQVLSKTVLKNHSSNSSSTAKNTDETKNANDVLSFMKKTDMEELTDYQQGMDPKAANSPSDQLKLVKQLLGISDQKWSEIISELEGNSKEKLKDLDPTSILTEGLAIIAMNPSLTSLSNNQVLFLKAAKMYSLLSNQESSGQQYLSGLLNSIQEQLQTAVQNSKAQSKLTYLQNTFSQLVSDLKEQTSGVNQSNIVTAKMSQSNDLTQETNQSTSLASATNQSNSQKTPDSLIDWNPNSSFMQLMSKPEQIAAMGGGTKSISVNDLIQQFESILSKSQFSKTGGMQKLLIKLNPESLGSISIELVSKDQGITAKILTTTEAAKEALESHLHNLQHAFEAQNIKVDHVEIAQQSSQSQQDDLWNGGQTNQQQTPEDQTQQTNNDEESDGSFILTLEEAILNQKV
jgi:flagellar hook-length control protein FliK